MNLQSCNHWDLYGFYGLQQHGMFENTAGMIDHRYKTVLNIATLK